MPFNKNRIRFSRVAIAIVVLIATSVSLTWGISTTSSPAKEAYYQIEGNVFNSSQIENAIMKVSHAFKADSNDPWAYLAASLATLVSGYKIGDWYSTETFTEGSVNKAFQLAAKAREIDPQNDQCQAHFARLLIVKGEFKKAEDVLNEAYRLNPDSFYSWYFRGILAEKMHDFVRARGYLDEAEKRVIHNYQKTLTNTHLRIIAELSRDTNEQERLHKEIIVANQDKPQSYGNYATFLMEQKRYDEAINYWNKAIEIGPYPEAIKRLEETIRLKQSVHSQ